MKFPILGIMFLILFTLKVAEVGAVASWSWWLVTAPLWGGFALVGAFALLGVAAVYLAALGNIMRGKFRGRR